MGVLTNKLAEKYKCLPVQVKASFWFLICSFLQKGISVITTPIFTRLLSTAEYGKYSVFNSWLGMVSIFTTLNLFYGVYTQGLVKFDDDKDIFTSSLQGLTVVLVGGWTMVYLVTHDWWNSVLSLTTVQMFSMLVMIWATAVFNFWAAEQRVLYKYKALVLITLAVSIAKPVIGIFLVLHAEDKVTARILGLTLVEVIGYVGLFAMQMRRGKKFFSAKYWKYALSFNIPLIPHYLSLTVLNSADRIMIDHMVGSDEAGIYSLAYSIAQIMTLFNSALMNTLSPWIYQKIKAKKFEDIAKIAYLSLIGIAAVNLMLIALAPEAVSIFAPKSYYAAIYTIPPIAMGVYFMYMYDILAKFAFYYEKTNFIMIASVIGALLNVILNYILIKACGYIAAAYTTLACYIIFCGAHYIFMNKVCNMYCDGIRPYSLRKILRISVSLLACGFVLLITYNYLIIRYCIIAVMIAIIILKKNLIISSLGRFIDIKNEK